MTSGMRPRFTHIAEGPDDMPSHIKAALTGTPLSRVLLMALLPMSLVLVDCGGEGGGGSSPTAPGPSIFFTADRAAGSPSISMQSIGGSTPSVLQLEIVATDLPNFQAVDFELAFPIDQLRYEGFEHGALIGAGAEVNAGAATSAVTFEILRTVPGPTSGTGVIVTITFSAVGQGQGRFDFVDPVAEDPFGLDIAGIDWIGGTVRVIL